MSNEFYRQTAMVNLVIPSVNFEERTSEKPAARVYAFGGNAAQSGGVTSYGSSVIQFSNGFLYRSTRLLSASFPDATTGVLRFDGLLGRPGQRPQAVDVIVIVRDETDEVRVTGVDRENRVIFDTDFYTGPYWSLFVWQHSN
ncbi:MAG: hypothetical protein QXI19_05830 [Candidatus Caldarchaeum sp.]